MRMKIADEGKCINLDEGGCCCVWVENYTGECLKYSLHSILNDDNRNEPCMKATGGKALYMATEDELKEVE